MRSKRQEGKTITFHTSAVTQQLYLANQTLLWTIFYIAIFYIHAPSQPYSKDVLTRMTNSKTSFQYFTYFEEQESCLAFANCEDFSQGTCAGQEACFSGSRDCGGEIPTSYAIIANCSMRRNMTCLQKHLSCFVKCEASFQSENGQFRALLL